MRPAGRSLSVHQGKGASACAAKIGALCEAIECALAERVAADGPHCSYAALDPAGRAPDVGDYGRDRARPPSASARIRWCSAVDLATGAPHVLPHELVSLDLTGFRPSAFERSSDGLGVGATEADAIATALCEVVERDAVGAWDRAPREVRRDAALRLESVPFDWFRQWLDRLRALGVTLRIFAPGAVGGLPTFIVSIAGGMAFGPDGRRFSGSASHAEPEIALFKALAEAIQSRLTFIAGVRDDILPSTYDEAPGWQGSAPPPGRRHWGSIAPVAPGWPALAARLAEEGYDLIVMKRLDDDEGEIAAVKVFVPGLGSLGRTRRIAR